MANLIYVNDSKSAYEIKASYVALGYEVKINVNHAAFINSPVRSNDLFIVVITKKS
jgi:hypothetical protein